MPFKSEKQRRYFWANEPEIARDWTDTYGSKIHAADGGIMRLPFKWGGPGSGRDERGYLSGHGSYSGGDNRGQHLSNQIKTHTTAPGTLSDPEEKRDYFEQSWTGPKGLFSGGYRNLKTPGVTAGGHKSRFNPMGIIGGLGGLLMGIPGLSLGINALSSLGKHKTLADWWGGRSNWSTNQTPNYEDMSQYNKLGIGGIDPALLDNYSDLKIRDTSFLPTTSVDEEAVEAYNNYYSTTPDDPISFEEFVEVTGRQ